MMTTRRSPSQAQPPVLTDSPLRKLEQFEFHDVLSSSNGPALVMFSSVMCGGCRHLKAVLERVAGKRRDWQYFVVDAGRDAALVHEFEIFHLPTLLLFNAGDFHCELQAEARIDAIVAAVESALQSPPDPAP